MPDINSPLGRRAFAMANQRVLTVPNEENEIAAFAPPIQQKESVEQDINSIQQTRKERIAAAKKITSTAKERVEMLTGLGRCYDTVEFEGIIFSIRSLKSKETRAVVNAANDGKNASDSFFIARDHTLAYSIYEIDGEPTSWVIGGNTVEDVIAFLEEMDESLPEYIHNGYLKMIKKKKVAIADNEDAKEVAEDIKK